MLIIKYSKKGESIFLSHLDTLRSVDYAIRRSGLEVAFSKGFNPHREMYFSSPIGVGIYSDAEYCTLVSDEPTEEFKTRFNANSLSSIQIDKVFITETNLNLAKIGVAAEYEVTFEGCGETCERLLEQMDKPEIFIEKIDKKTGETVRKDVRKRILDYKSAEGKIILRLTIGNENLRPDLLVKTLMGAIHEECASLTVLKTKMFAEKNGELVDFDELFV